MWLCSEPVCWSDWPLSWVWAPGPGYEWARTFYSQGKLVPRVLCTPLPRSKGIYQICSPLLLKMVRSLMPSFHTFWHCLPTCHCFTYFYVCIYLFMRVLNTYPCWSGPFMILPATMQFTRDWRPDRDWLHSGLSGGWGLIARHFRLTSKKCALTISRVSTKPLLLDPAQCCGSRRIQFWYSSNKSRPTLLYLRAKTMFKCPWAWTYNHTCKYKSSITICIRCWEWLWYVSSIAN